jgi:hypothetical protein
MARAPGTETVTFGFTGVVTSIDPDFIGVIGGTSVVDIGDSITGSFTYDLNAPGTTEGTGPGGIVIRTDYLLPVPPGAVSYSVGGLTVTVEAGSEFFVLVGNGTPSDLAQDEVDTFIVGADSSQPTPLESVFRLQDSTQSAFSNTSLPALLNLEAFDRRQFEVNFINPSGFANRLFVTSIDTLARGIAIDIKPSSKLNRINPRRGVISVVILSTPTFDATTLDPETVLFGPRRQGQSTNGSIFGTPTGMDSSTSSFSSRPARQASRAATRRPPSAGRPSTGRQSKGQMPSGRWAAGAISTDARR